MEFFQKAPGTPSRLGILPGTFNPVTVAHIGLAYAALGIVDEVVFVLPRAFPHKQYFGASFDQRIDLLKTALAGEPAFSLAVSDEGLFVDIAEDCRATYGNATRKSFLCGRDAAERTLGWDYGDPQAAAAMLRHFDLLVADRSGIFHPPSEFALAVQRLPLPRAFEAISATEVRERIARGEAWEHLVPESVREPVRRIFATARPRD